MAECQLPRMNDGQVRPPRPPPPFNMSVVITTTKDFTRLHERAYQCISKAQTHDDGAEIDNAVNAYTEGLKILQKALLVDCGTLQGTDLDIDSTKQMQQKMRKAKLQVEYRLQSLQVFQGLEQDVHTSRPPSIDSLPSYEEATSTVSPINHINSFVSLGDNIMSEEQNGVQVVNASEIYSIEDGVQIFFITPDGYVSAPSYPASLKIFTFREDAPQDPERPPAFLQVGDWYYPLIPNTSPVLHTSYKAYLFPDYASSQQGWYNIRSILNKSSISK